jgi:hypothetical protein
VANDVVAPRRGIRSAVAALIIIGAAAYTLGVVMGWISKERQIDLSHLGVIAVTAALCAILIVPDLFGRLRSFEMQGIKIELLERVREKQLQQEDQLRDLRLIIPLLLPDAEHKHLRNLAAGRTQAYRGSENLRGELRHLRMIGLIRMVEGHWVSHLDDKREVDLAEFVELTDLGKQWANKLVQLDEPHDAPTR